MSGLIIYIWAVTTNLKKYAVMMISIDGSNVRMAEDKWGQRNGEKTFLELLIWVGLVSIFLSELLSSTKRRPFPDLIAGVTVALSSYLSHVQCHDSGTAADIRTLWRQHPALSERFGDVQVNSYRPVAIVIFLLFSVLPFAKPGRLNLSSSPLTWRLL